MATSVTGQILTPSLKIGGDDYGYMEGASPVTIHEAKRCANMFVTSGHVAILMGSGRLALL